MLKRILFKSIEKHLESEKITIITGARQTGKTTLLRQIETSLKHQEKAFIYLTLEDTKILSLLNEHPEKLFDVISKQPHHRYVLIDEIQYLNDPSNFLKYIFDMYKDVIKLVVTGSSAFYIDQKFKDSLAGRKKLFRLFPLSFKEYLLAKNEGNLMTHLQEIPTYKKNSIALLYRQKLRHYLNDYLRFGGYPDIVLADDIIEKKELLKELYFSFLKKDFLESKIKNEIKAYQLLKILAEQTGSLVNKNELSKTLGVSIDAIDHYLYVMEKSFIIYTCTPFHKTVRKELTKMSKIYFYDVGYRNAVLNNFDMIENRLDRGAYLENSFFAMTHLHSEDRIQFWRTQDKKEVDFILDQHRAFELKFKEGQFLPNKYKKFTTSYPNIPLEAVVWDSETTLDLLDFA